jgi:hypothetical protein
MIKRDNFSVWQKQVTFDASANEVRLLWPDTFQNAPAAHFICAHCRFVNSDQAMFEVDHIVSCKEGGNANRESVERVTQLQAQANRPLDQQDIGILMSANFNDQLLCIGCNQGKKSKGMRPDEIPAGCGYAYQKHDEDMNPDHIYGGRPNPTGNVLPRYRKA